MKKVIAFVLCFILVCSTSIRPVSANPALVVLGAEGLVLLEGLAIKQGLRFAGKELSKVFFKSAVKRSPTVLTDMQTMTRSVVTVGSGKALKYTLTGATAAALMGSMAEYAGEISGAATTPIPLEYYDAYSGTGDYIGAANWYIQEYGHYVSGDYTYSSGVNFHYLDSQDNVWKVYKMAGSAVPGTYQVALSAPEGINVNVVITYQRNYTGSMATMQRYYPLGTSTVVVGDTVLLRHPFPRTGVEVGQPRALPIPTTGEFDIYLPLPLDSAYDVLEGNPEFVDTPIENVQNPPDTTTPIPGTPPPYTLPNTATFNFEPMRIAGDTLKRKFPFSIPWDIENQLSVFNVEPKTPVFNVDHKVPLFDSYFQMKFKVNFSMFDGLAAIVRWFLIIAFDLALILSIRRMLPE